MRFKSTISHYGLNALEKHYLPTLEKFGKHCDLMLSPEDVYLIQDVTDADGMQIVARLSGAVVFDDAHESYCESNYNDLIGLHLELALLLKVLRSAAAHEADTLDVRLSNRRAPGNSLATPQVCPMLAFSWRGNNVTMKQEMPVSAPHQQAKLAQLRQLCDDRSLCPFYLDILPQVPSLVGVLDKLKSLLGVAGVLTLALSRQGDLHLSVDGQGVRLGDALTGLSVLPEGVAQAARQLTATTAEGRMWEGQAHGEVESVRMHVKHLSKALHSCHLTSPVRILCGVAPGGAYLHLMFVYNQPGTQEYDDSFFLAYKLPILEDL